MQFHCHCVSWNIFFPRAEGFRLAPPVTAHPHLPVWAGSTITVPTPPDSLAQFHQTEERRYCLHWFAVHGYRHTCFRACCSGWCSDSSWLEGCCSRGTSSFSPYHTSCVCKCGVTALHSSIAPLQPHSADSLKPSRISGFNKALRPL